MGRRHRCPGCGARLDGGGRCPACAGFEVELEDLGVEGEGAGTELDLGPGRSGRLRGIVVVAGLVAGVVAVASFLDGGGDREATAPPPEPPPPVTTAPRVPTTTVPVFETDRMWAPLLPSGSEAVLYGLSFDAEVVRIDVDRGLITRRLLRGPNVARLLGFGILGREGAAVLSAPGLAGALAVGDGPDARPRWIDWDDGRVLPAAAPTELWQVARLGDLAVAQRIDLTGVPVGPVLAVPSGGVVLGDDGTGALLVRTADGVVVLREGGAGPEPLTSGDLMAWSASTLVLRACDGDGCAWEVVDRASGTAQRLPSPPEVQRGRSWTSAAVAPDGSRLALVGPDGSLTVVDLADGTTTQVADDVTDQWGFGYAASAAWWGPGSRHLFWLGADRRARAWLADSGDVHVVDGMGRVPLLQSMTVAP